MDSKNMSSPGRSGWCLQGCGFYGSSATNGFCSKCFKDLMNSPAAGTANQLQPPDNDKPSDSGFVSSAAPTSSSIVDQSASVTVAHIVTPVITSNVPSSSSSSSKSFAVPPESAEQQPGENQNSETKSNRCATCRKKVGLTGFLCRCSQVFCGLHRYAEAHNCTFDYKALAKEEIRKNNPVVKAPKIDKL